VLAIVGARRRRIIEGMTHAPRSRTLAGLVLVAALPLAALAAGCGGDSGTVTTTVPKTSSGKTATIGLASEGTLGKILVDADDHTLYLFQKDQGDRSTCTGACASAWPPLRASGKPAVGAGLTAAKVGTTARSDGKPQVTYNGHPVYRYSGDQQAGDTNGQGVSAFGAAWYALSASGTMVAGKGSGSGGGYSY
jgi:predicted lipoprotein with Yx(FWY)xxD motif